jgi:hypothetical protein
MMYVIFNNNITENGNERFRCYFLGSSSSFGVQRQPSCFPAMASFHFIWAITRDFLNAEVRCQQMLQRSSRVEVMTYKVFYKVKDQFGNWNLIGSLSVDAQSQTEAKKIAKLQLASMYLSSSVWKLADMDAIKGD